MKDSYLTYNELLRQAMSERKSIVECFDIWRELVVQLAQSKKAVQGHHQFERDEKGCWQQLEAEELDYYYSPARASYGGVTNVAKEELYRLGCLLYETLFFRSPWREKRIRHLDQFIERGEQPLFEAQSYAAADYVSSAKGEAVSEVQFIFDLLEALLHPDENERPVNKEQLADWLKPATGPAMYYGEQEVEGEDGQAYVGIDLGTTNTVVVLAKNGQLQELRIEGALTIPSAVFFESPNSLYFGRQALVRGVNYPASLATSFKRYMEGVDGHYPTRKYAATGDELELTGMKITQLFLTWVREQAMKEAKMPLHYAVITVPADFDPRKIEATRRAALDAGYTDVSIEREPNAAGYAYLYAERKAFNGEKNIFVYDLGGGTLDVSVLQRTGESTFEIVGREGDEHLGGDLFNEALVRWIVEKVQEQYFEFDIETPLNYIDERHYYNAKKIIADAANEAKHQLSVKDEVAIKLRQLPITDDEIVPLVIPITRAEFEELIEEYVARAEVAITRALQLAKETKRVGIEQIDDVVLAGGSSLTPAIKRSVERYFGKLSNKALNMSTMIARGAALFALMKWSVEETQSLIQTAVINQATHDFGVAVSQEGSRHLAFKMLIPAGQPLPFSKTATFHTETDDQEMLEVIIARRSRHERETATLISHAGVEVIDKMRIPHLPKAPARTLSIDVTFQFDGIGNLATTVAIYDQNKQLIEQRDLLKQAELL